MNEHRNAVNYRRHKEAPTKALSRTPVPKPVDLSCLAFDALGA